MATDPLEISRSELKPISSICRTLTMTRAESCEKRTSPPILSRLGNSLPILRSPMTSYTNRYSVISRRRGKLMDSKCERLVSCIRMTLTKPSTTVQFSSFRKLSTRLLILTLLQTEALVDWTVKRTILKKKLRSMVPTLVTF